MTNSSEIPNKQHDTTNQTEHFDRWRPALVIGAGGTGQQILTYLKKILQERHGSKWKQKIQLLSFDTAEEAFVIDSQDGPISLEPGVEFHYIGNVPVPRIRRNLNIQATIQQRLGSIMSSLPATVLRSGAKQLRPFGLMGFLWNYLIIFEALREAIWKLARRNRSKNSAASQQQGINVFICFSLVGGTGSGIFLDLTYLVRSLFTELGTQAEFSHITAVGLLPQAFQGIEGPNIFPNTAAALEEINYLMVDGNFQTKYQDGRFIDSQEAPFNLFYLIDGVDERGQTWSGLPEVCAMTAEGIALQMGSQIGIKGENDFDNLDEILIGQMPNGDGTFFGSFGLAYLEFDAPTIADICTKKFILDVAANGWLQSKNEAAASDTASSFLATISEEQMQTLLQHDPENNSEIQVDLPIPTWLPRKPADELPTAAFRYVYTYGQARLVEKFIPLVRQNGDKIVKKEQEKWDAWLRDKLLDPQSGLNTVSAILNSAEAILTQQLKSIRKKLAQETARYERASEALSSQEAIVTRAASSFPIGRNGRIRSALNKYFQIAQSHFEIQLQQQSYKTQLHAWNEIAAHLRARTQQARTIQDRLHAIASALENEIPVRLSELAKGSTSRTSLADAEYVDALYQHHKPPWTDLKHQVGDPFLLCEMSTKALSTHFHQSLTANFQEIANLNIEQVIADRAAEMSPEARRRQLDVDAGASWNIDRTRLPDGGTNLVRLSVIGVPNANDTLFSGENLVSTHDPHRLVALTVVAGSPQSALQQYDLYRQALENSHSRKPLYVLPAFLTSADQGKLAFALASILGLTYSQGTFFYYKPADPLASPVKLANGLLNSIQALTEHDGLVSEIMERVDAQIARIGLHDAIQILTEYYSTIPDGNTQLDEELRELKRLVRNYAEDLRRFSEFNVGLNGRPARQQSTR